MDNNIYYLDNIDDNYGENANGIMSSKNLSQAIQDHFPNVSVVILDDDITCSWREHNNAELLCGDVDSFVQKNWCHYVVYKNDDDN